MDRQMAQLLRKGRSQERVGCFFCRRRKLLLNFYPSLVEDENRPLICDDCLAACRRVLQGERKDFFLLQASGTVIKELG
jgi:hypothetical protein